MNANQNEHLPCRGGALSPPEMAGRHGGLPLRILMVLFLAVPLHVEARSNAAIKAFNDGVQAFNARQFNEAIPSFDAAISEDSEFAEAYFARGACKYYLKSLDGALLDLNDALRLKPDNTNARALRGAINYESDRWDDALEDFNAVLSQNPKDAQSLLGRAVILLKREDRAGAARDFKDFLRERPNDPLAPKVQQLLASMKRAGGQGKPPPAQEQAPSNEAGNPPSASPRSSSSAAHRPTSIDLQKLADSLFSHSLSDPYDQKVLRGEKAQAVGDIHSVPGVPGDSTTSDDKPQIVEPQ